MFVTTATCGLRASVSSWNEESSSTTMSSFAIVSSSWMIARPILPPTITRRRPRERIRPISVVVVVFPLVPVTPTIVAGHSRKNSPISVSTGICRCSARRIVAERGRTPLITNTNSGSASAASSLDGPSTSLTGVSPRRPMPSASCSRVFASVMVTLAPHDTRNLARPEAVRPLPRPTIVTRRPRKSSRPISASKRRLTRTSR